MLTIIEGLGVFIYPLGLCSLLAVFVIAERMLALRQARVIPDSLMDVLISGDLGSLPEKGGSVAERIVRFYHRQHPEPETFKAYVRMELARLERGVFVLDTIIVAAPLLGLLGTVTGLIHVFGSNVSATGVPETQAFVKGVSLALTTTVAGLVIAIPSVFFQGVITRRIDLLSTRIDMLAERLMEMNRKSV